MNLAIFGLAILIWHVVLAVGVIMFFLDFVLFGIVVGVTCTGLSTRHGDRGGVRTGPEATRVGLGVRREAAGR
jgi:hypothetical protein